MIHDLRRLLLVRHGETDWNREGRFQGRSDQPMNDTGRAQSRALAARLRTEMSGAIDAIYASPLLRAAETAQILAEAVGRAPTHVDDLRERDVGNWGGLTYDEIKARFPDDWARAATGHDVAFGGGETMAQVQARIVAALDGIAARHPGGAVLVVSHGLALKTLVCRLLELDLAHADRLTTGGNTGLTIFEMRRGMPRMTVYADTRHLAATHAVAP